MNRADISHNSQKRFVAFFKPLTGKIIEEEQAEKKFSLNMPCRNTSISQAGLDAGAVSESSSPESPHPSVSMQAQGEMSNESQPHAHADRIERRQNRWEKKERTERQKEGQQERKRDIKQTEKVRARVTSPIPVGAEYTVCVRGIGQRANT